MKEFERRKTFTRNISNDFKLQLSSSDLLLQNQGCIYVTGSFGRLEASEGSDIDAFISSNGSREERSVSGIDEILVKADLIKASKKLKLPEFDGDGSYLKVFSHGELTNSIGSREDDYENTFTARLLLLLEGRPLVGSAIFDELRSKIVQEYWKDFDGNEKDFVPAYFCNDVLRLWRTFCVNYEARTSDDTPEKKAKRRAKNYKLRHARIMTCYSALALFLSKEAAQEVLSPDLALDIFKLTPIERIELLLERNNREASKVLNRYEKFLETSRQADFQFKFSEDKFNTDRRIESRAFSEAIFELLFVVGKDTTLLKRLLV